MKKSFMNDFNPAEAFITTPKVQDREAQEKALEAERARYSRPRLTKRLNLLITDELYKALKDLSRYDGNSINNTINKVLAEYVNNRTEDVKKIRSL